MALLMNVTPDNSGNLRSRRPPPQKPKTIFFCFFLVTHSPFYLISLFSLSHVAFSPKVVLPFFCASIPFAFLSLIVCLLLVRILTDSYNSCHVSGRGDDMGSKYGGIGTLLEMVMALAVLLWSFWPWAVAVAILYKLSYFPIYTFFLDTENA